MAGDLQPLDQKFPIVKPDGKPTDYFIRWAQTRQIDIQDGITLEQLVAYLADHVLQSGSGITLTPSGNIDDSPTIAADVQAILDQITNVQGSVLYRAAGAWAALAPGAAGNVLSTNGAGADPTWIAAGGGGGGGLVLLEEHTAAGVASLDFTASISATYDEYLIEFVNVTPATNGVDLLMRMSTNAGVSYDAGANYSGSRVATNRFGQAQTGSDSGSTSIPLNYSAISNSVLMGYCGHERLFSPGSTTRHKLVNGIAIILASDGTTVENEQVAGVYRSTTAVNAFQFLFSAGNIASGTIRVYGLAK